MSFCTSSLGIMTQVLTSPMLKKKGELEFPLFDEFEVRLLRFRQVAL